MALAVCWTDESHQVVSSMLSSPDQLAKVIAQVRALAEPTMLFVESDEKKTLMLGLGAPQSVLSFIEADGRRFHSVGDLSRIGAIPFWCRDQLDDFFADMAVPESLAIEAALSFAATGERPPNLRWEADW